MAGVAGFGEAGVAVCPVVVDAEEAVFGVLGEALPLVSRPRSRCSMRAAARPLSRLRSDFAGEAGCGEAGEGVSFVAVFLVSSLAGVGGCLPDKAATDLFTALTAS